MARNANDLSSRIAAFQNKVDRKRELISAKADILKERLLATTPKKQEDTLVSSLLDFPEDKDFSWQFNARDGRLDGDTINAVSPYTRFYGQNVDGVKDRTVTEPVRLGQSGASIDTYETRKTDAEGNVLPYPENKKRQHQIHYARQNGLPSYTMVSDDMLYDAAEQQTTNLLEKIYKGNTWGEYGSTLKDGTTVPYPEDVQSKLNLFQKQLEEAKQVQADRTDTLENREEVVSVPSPGAYLGTLATNAFNTLRDNIREDTATDEVKEIETKIAELKISSRAKQDVKESLLTGNVDLDIKRQGKGIYDRQLGVLINPETGENINTELNTPANNPAYMSKYNKAFADKVSNEVNQAIINDYGKDGLGFWRSIGPAFEGGVDTVQATGFAFAAYLVDLFPTYYTEELAGRLLDKYLEKLNDSQRHYNRMPRIEEIDWSNKTQVLSKLGDALGEGIPSIATIIAGGGVGGFVAKTAAKRMATSAANKAATRAAKKKALDRIKTLGQRSAVATTAIGLQTGSIYGDVAAGPDGDRSWRAKALTLVGGVASGSLEMLFPMSFFKKAGMSNKTTSAIKDKFSKRIAALGAKITKESAAGGITEGTTEGLQFIIEEITQEYIKTGELPEFASEEFKSGFFNSVFAGFVPGGGMRLGTSTLSGIRDTITTDAAQVKKAVQEVQQQAKEAEDAVVTGEEDTASQTQLFDEVKAIEDTVDNLGIELSKKYNKKTNVDKGLELSDSLNTLEIDLKAVPKAKRNQEQLEAITAAKESLNAALNNVNTGDAFIKSNTQAQIVESTKNRKIAKIKNRFARLREKFPNRNYDKAEADAIAVVERKAAKDLAPIIKKAEEGKKAGTDVIVKDLQKTRKQISAITRKLKDPKLSKKQRKRLIYERNALARKMDTASMQGKKRIKLPPGLRMFIEEDILESDWYQNRKVETKSKSETNAEIKAASKAFDEYVTERDSKNPDRAKLQKLKRNAIEVFNKLEKVIPILRSDLAKTTDPKVKARLTKDLNKYVTLSKKLQKEFIVDKEATAKANEQAKEDKSNEILNSLDINVINEGINDEVLGSLNKKQQANVNSRKGAAKSAKKIKSIIKNTSPKLRKSLATVHKEILKGTTRAKKGIETYLKDAKNNKLERTQLQNFVERLVLKNARLKEAYALYEKNEATVYVSKDSYEIFENNKALPKGAKLNNYFYINKRSTALLALMQEEVDYVTEVKNIILDVSENLETAAKEAEIKKEEAIDEQAVDEILQETVEDTGTIEDVTAPTEEVVEETPKEEVKQEAKPTETETTKPETTETKKEKRTRERARLNELEKELTQTLNGLKKQLDDLNKLEKVKGNQTRRKEIKAIKNQITLIQNRLKNEIDKKRSQREVSKANHFLNKSADLFNKLRWNPSGITVRELFKIKDLGRRSFFAMNKTNILTENDIKSKLKDLGVDNVDYINLVAKQFTEFKTIFNEKINIGLTDDEIKQGSYTAREAKLLLDKDGNMSDEVLFAMLLSLMHWSAVNQKASETRPLFTIANLVFNDPKQVNRLTGQQIKTFIDAGIFAKDAAKEIGLEVLDALNMTIEQPAAQEMLFKLQAIANKTFNIPLSKRSNLKPRLATALGLLALQTGRYMDADKRPKKGQPENGIIEVIRGEYDITLFDNDNFDFIAESNKTTIDWNSVQIKESTILDTYKNNSENFKLIKGAEVFTRDTYETPVLDVQEETDNSFFILNKKIKRVMLKLQAVRWEGKREELKLFDTLKTDVLHKLVGIKDLNTQHKEDRDSVEASNQEKLKDIDHTKDYIKSGDNPGFYFRYKAQTQHRLRIVSNTINGQRSKIHRALFNPTGSETVIDNKSKREVFKLAVIQAFGYNITTLKEGQDIFNRINKNANVKKLVAELKKANPSPEIINATMIDLMNDSIVDSVSTHLLEGIVALSKYKQGKFTTSLGVETDGITNGYAISLLQFLDGDKKNPKKLKDALARVGVNVSRKEAKETYERFVAAGNDDVYQSFARKIAEAIFGADTRFNENQQKAINNIHGKLLSPDGLLTSFARNLAKTPVMVSNYGGSIIKIISNVLESIVPNMYTNLGDFQTKYNNGNEVDKVKIRGQVKDLQDAINDVLNSKYDLVSKLDKKNNLYEFTLSDAEASKITNYFEDIYAGEDTIFETALNELIAPTIKAREILVKVVEAEFFIFKEAYDKQVGNLGNKITDIDVKMRIAADLADEIMPRMSTPWGDPKNARELIQLIKFVDSKDNRVEVTTQDFKNQKYRKNGRNWTEVGKPVNEGIIGANTTAKDFISPGVGSVVNGVQNVESSILGDLLDQKQDVLPIFDAVYSPIGTAIENSDIFNKRFLEVNLKHVLLEEALKQFRVIKGNMKKFGVTEKAVNERLQEESYRAKIVNAEISKGNKDNENELSRMTLKDLESDLMDKIQDRLDNLELLEETYGPVTEWTISQMPLPESIKDSSLAPVDTTKPKVAVETVEKEIIDIGEPQGDPTNAIDAGQEALDAFEREQREAYEAEELAEIIANNPEYNEAEVKAEEERKERQAVYQQAKKTINKLIKQQKPYGEHIDDDVFVAVEIDNSIPSLASVRSIDFSDPLERLDDDGDDAEIDFRGIEVTIRFNINQIVSDYIKGMVYIEGKGSGINKINSKQKQIVFADINVEAFKKHIKDTGGVEAYINFIYEHEQGHIVNGHNVTGLDPLSEEAINIEKEANEYAFKAIGFNNVKPKDKTEKKSNDLNDVLDAVNNESDIPGDIDLNSIQSSVDKELELVYRTNSLGSNLQAIFEKLGVISVDSYINEKDKNTQQVHLQRVIDEIVTNAGSVLDSTTLTLNKSKVKSDGSANVTQNSIKVNYNRFRPRSYSEQTSQEVYVHEIVHILTRFVIKNDSVFRRRLEKLRSQVIKEIERTEARPYEVFLHRDAAGQIIYRTNKQAEIEAAKEQYEYVFGNAVPAKFRLDEFLAYALTNKFIVQKTESMESQKIPLWSKDENKRVTEKIIEFFAEVYERLSKLATRTSAPISVQQEIFELTRDIVDINQSKRNVLNKALQINLIRETVNKGNRVGAKIIEEVTSNSINIVGDNWIKFVDKVTKDGKVNGFFADVLYDTKLVAYLGSSYRDFVKKHPEVQKKLNSIYRNIKPSFLNNASSLWSNGFGGDPLSFIRLLYKSKYDVDGKRTAFKENTKKNVRKLFLTYDDLTTSQKESITRVLLKTDLSSLLENEAFTQDEILELIRDDAKLDKAIKLYESKKKLNIRQNNFYRLQTSQLALYMITGDTYAYQQKLNAVSIYNKSIAKNRAYPKQNKEQEIKDLDTYITLLALRRSELDYAKQDVSLIMQNEFAQKEHSKDENAFIGMLNTHIAFKQESKETLFLDKKGKPNGALMTKGYIANVTDSDAKLTVERSDPDNKAKMLSEGYTFISDVDNFTSEKYGLYVIYNSPTEPRTKGIASMTSMQFQGTDLKEILSRNPKMSGFIMKELDKAKRKQEQLSRKGKLSKKPTMIPVIDEDGNVSTYRFTLSHALSEQHLKQDLQFDEVFATMQSHMIDKQSSEAINKQTVELMYKYGKENYSKNPNKFVNILDKAHVDEYYAPLTKNMKYDVLYYARINPETGKEEFWVERRLLDTIFGYQNPSVSNINSLQYNDRTKRYTKVVEKGWKELIGQAKINIVIKTPIVPAVNFLSNAVTSWMYGVPIPYIVKYWREAAIELNIYRTKAEQLKDLDFRMKANPALKTNASMIKKREVLVADMNANKVAPFVTQGLFNSITEDINQDEFTYRNKLFTKLKETKGGQLVSGRALDIANIAYIGEKTKIFKEATHFLQISDFIARYALYKHQTEVEGVSEDAAYKTMIETFVNYDQPLNRYLAYANDMGLIMFVKYWVRIQRAGFNLIKEKPLNSGLLFFGNGVLDLDIETILDSSILTGNFMPTYGGIENNLEQALIPPGIEILMGKGF